MTRVLSSLTLAITVAGVSLVAAQRGGGPNAPQTYIKYDAPVIALTHVRVIDGTGADAQENQTLVIRDGRIAALGAAASATVPEGATVIDGTSKSVMPGLVMLHEHLYYPTGPGIYGQLGQSFTRLYLAGGVTTMRTAGNVSGVTDIVTKQKIDRGEAVGPTIDATAPYLEGPNNFLQMHALADAADAKRQVEYWADMGATSFKAYMDITRDELKAAIDAAHARKMKVTGHLCSVTYAEAAALGIDNLEHGFAASTDFVKDKPLDKCPGQPVGQQTIVDLDPEGAPFKALVKTLVDRKIALTSTLTVFETFTPGRPKPPGLDVLVSDLRTQFEQTYAQTQQRQNSIYSRLFPKMMTLERAFVKAGGVLVSGTDPTGSGGVIPGYSNQRQLELLVEEGFTPLQAISIGTLNGARYLGRDADIGSVAVGKQADLILLSGNPAADITDVRKVDIVFRRGIGFDSARLIQSVAGKVGLW